MSAAFQFMLTAFYALVGSVCIVATAVVVLVGVLSIKAVMRNQQRK